MKKHKGISLLESLIGISITSIIALSAISGVLGDLPNHKVKDDAFAVKQALITTRSIAVKTSRTTVADFSIASVNNGSDGGIIQIKNLNGTVLRSFKMNKNVKFNPTVSTIANAEVRFDYQGQPVDNTGEVNGFNENNNMVTISFYKSNSSTASKNIKIIPVSGAVIIE